MNYLDKTGLRKLWAKITSVFAKKTEIPSKISQLNNDSGFIASNVVNGFWKGTQEQYNALSTKNDSTLYLINNAGFSSLTTGGKFEIVDTPGVEEGVLYMVIIN